MGRKNYPLELIEVFRTHAKYDEAIWQREIAYLANLYSATNNPLYAWQVMSLYCRYGGHYRLPDWCQVYFSDVSNNLFALSRNRDIRNREFEWSNLKPFPPIDATAALELVPLAVGLSGRQGKSLLADFNSRLIKGFEVSLYQNLRENGLSRRAATDILLRITNRQDERSLRRAFAESEVQVAIKHSATASRANEKKNRATARSTKGGKTSPRSRARAKPPAK